MRQVLPALAHGRRPAPLAEPHLISLADEWALWRDIAVRTAGFPVSGLEIFGSPDEQEGLRAVARDPLFQTAVTWQNRAAMRNAVAKIAAGATAPGSRQRQREEVVASYWQRYCAKNDTIGFFGPLAWGRAADDGPALHVKCGQLVSESTVCFEAWAIQALAEALDPRLTVPAGPQAERDLRTQLEHSPPGLRHHGLAALDRLERCRSAAAHAADPLALDTALGDLDRAFEELTGRPATRRPGQTYAARTLLYLDCMRDVDLTAGPALRGELAMTLPPLLAGARWYCGQVYQAARQVISDAAAAAGTRSLDRVLEKVLPALRHLPDVAAAANSDLQRRWSALLADPDAATIGARAAAAFADHIPAWPISVYQSADVQIAAPSAAAVNAGDYLCVVGDFHPGANPLGQGVFATRHPDRDQFLGAIASDVGTLPFLIPPRDAGFQTTRNMPAITRPGDVHVAASPRDRMASGYRTLSAAELITDSETVTTADGSWQAPLAHLLWLPMLIAAVHAYDPFPADGHGPRITIGRTVWRRETWHIPPAQGPACPEGAASWARDFGLPRRAFVLSPGELKPIYIDFDSPVLTRILCRQLRRADTAFPGRPLRFTEMLPEPGDCWLTDQDGRRYTSELRLVAVDLGRAPSGNPHNRSHDRRPQ